MDKELAQMVVMTAARARIGLGDLVPIMKEHSDGEKDEQIKHAVASAVYEIGIVIDRIFEQHPDLGQEYEARRSKYRRPYY